ncbi:DUF2252 domain-containing protein [Salsipaludibacter albus]|uniref:DUF2252 domain-containing protein n=1 Tax=Salsipaludibacter albus TaxID=2849650 RepID=UPI001EE45E69|nr:DUF2252 domain-containing protein [Salsipaludibacter albus]MBY5161313.1 DUF2252 domain-containing protein [Salsipaludibacter albus]
MTDIDTPAERTARGKGVRAEVPRSAHAGWEPPAGRADPVDLLASQDATRVPELVPLRHERMLASPFTFFRGAALLMANDLADRPRTGLDVQLCGDAHLSNFGVYAAPDRRLIFSLNDFDETLPGPFEWDVQRLATSFAVAGRDSGFRRKHRDRIVRTAVQSYREAMREFADQHVMDVWYARLDVDEIERRHRGEASKRQRKTFDKVVSKARTKNSLRAADKLTHDVDGVLRFRSDPPLVVPIEELVPDRDARDVSAAVGAALDTYRASLPNDRQQLLGRFRYVHLARKVVGVGSVGTRAWVVLLQGRDTSDPLLLQVKEAQQSVLETALGPSSHDNHGERVVAGQRLLQAAGDILLGWTRTEGIDGTERDFYVRQLWDNKGSARIDRMDDDGMQLYARICGWTLAHAHARSGDPMAIAGYLGSGTSFDTAIASFAADYADQNERDYAAVRAAVDQGRLSSEPPAA